ncbi:hypothetical protein TSA6c_00095 [Azospirillum sp. TSA6c]|uniref:hypothetical protein n=1 Tax=Azospirillum sp. TSA6c TaxID=709813 RepID=UPI000D61FE9C|nr:hypothetical protein [Azospirillum sp. TSA6c]PWC54681.1 hypothetical protein TSA6c_00095 [Azospirillum sp. TSA6c]
MADLTDDQIERLARTPGSLIQRCADAIGEYVQSKPMEDFTPENIEARRRGMSYAVLNAARMPSNVMTMEGNDAINGGWGAHNTWVEMMGFALGQGMPIHGPRHNPLAATAEALWPWVRLGMPGCEKLDWKRVNPGSLAHDCAMDAARAALNVRAVPLDCEGDAA